jgi:hypothetical protein
MRGVTIYANWTAQQTTGKFKQLITAQASKFDMEGVCPLVHLNAAIGAPSSAHPARDCCVQQPSSARQQGVLQRLCMQDTAMTWRC